MVTSPRRRALIAAAAAAFVLVCMTLVHAALVSHGAARPAPIDATAVHDVTMHDVTMHDVTMHDVTMHHVALPGGPMSHHHDMPASPHGSSHPASCALNGCVTDRSAGALLRWFALCLAVGVCVVLRSACKPVGVVAKRRRPNNSRSRSAPYRWPPLAVSCVMRT